MILILQIAIGVFIGGWALLLSLSGIIWLQELIWKPVGREAWLRAKNVGKEERSPNV